MESENEEWKSIWKAEYLKFVASFFNTSGGRLIVGMEDDGRATGVQNPHDQLKEISDTIVNKLGIMPTVRTVSLDGKTCIEIMVEKGERLIDLDGRYYKRVGNTTQQIRGESLRSLLVEDMQSSWTDLRSSMKSDFIAEEAIEHFVKAGKEAKRIPLDIRGDPISVLERFELINTEGFLTYSAAILFGKNANRVIEGSFVKIGEFSSEGQLRREDVFKIPVIMQPDAVMKTLYEKYIPEVFEYNGAGRRLANRYPPKAVREALVNALTHKRYDALEPVTVRVDPDRLSIYNPGTLPQGWVVEDLMEEHTSVRRNKKLADVFHAAGYIEAWGKGIRLIYDSCKENGNPEPRFVIRQGGLAVDFAPRGVADYTSVGKSPGPNDPVINDSTVLTESEERIFELIKRDGELTASELSAHSGFSTRKVYAVLKSLSEKNIIIRVGSKKSGKWEITYPDGGNKK